MHGKKRHAAIAADAAAAKLVVNPEAPSATDDPGGYNDFWFEMANIGDTVRTSHIVYPLNGRTSPCCRRCTETVRWLGSGYSKH